ncbi:MAG: SIMPL domain-containing protein [Kofleriaceae bacterium]|nr:MAG: SIMPL domain-containing protein [Kofleriaceae bacterium]MBZ0231709.1 SIMPL domain-containing protein [Kofleriaceae bacterium]
MSVLVANRLGGIMSAVEKPSWFGGRELIALAIVALAAAPPLSTYIATQSWERVKVRPVERTIRVTGSAKQRIVSDLIEWNATVTADAKDKLAAYRKVHADVEATVAYLKGQGVPEGEIFPDSTVVEELFTTVYEGKGEDRIARQELVGYQARQTIGVRSKDVQRIERLSRQVTDLLEKDVAVTSGAPSYYYTKLGDLKIEMLSEASKDARTRAENMLRSAGGAALSRLKDADMGVINVNPANSTATSWEGNNDTSALEKDIIAIVHVTYALK